MITLTNNGLNDLKLMTFDAGHGDIEVPELSGYKSPVNEVLIAPGTSLTIEAGIDFRLVEMGLDPMPADPADINNYRAD